MVTLTAPDALTAGTPFTIAFTADTRVAGRIRITAGTEAIPFTLTREGKEPTTGPAHRVRGRSGTFTVSDWGAFPAGTELVLRFEGAKHWMTVS